MIIDEKEGVWMITENQTDLKRAETLKVIETLSLLDDNLTLFSELCTHGKRAYKYALQASGIYFIIKYKSKFAELRI